MRLDICFAVNTLRHVHLMVAKHLVRNLKGIVDYGLKYKVNQKIMWIRIGKKVPLIGRTLWGATSVWDQVWSLGLEGWSPTWCWVQLRQKLLPLAIWEVVCFIWKILFYLLDLTFIFVWCREEQWSRSRSLENGISSIVAKTGCLSINPSEAHRFLRHNQSYRLSLDVISPGEARRLSLDVIILDVILW